MGLRGWGGLAWGGGVDRACGVGGGWGLAILGLGEVRAGAVSLVLWGLWRFDVVDFVSIHRWGYTE